MADASVNRLDAVPPRDPNAPVFVAYPTRTKLLILAGVLIGLLMAALDQTIVATALPRVVADLGGFDRFAWVFTAYMLASTALIPVMGKLSDMYGRKWVYVGGMVVFMAGSMLSGTSQSMDQLIVFRGVQGVGAAALMGNAFTVLADLFEPADRGKWQGLFGGVFAIASVIGPVTGGYLTDNLDWRWIFYLNLPIGALAIAVLVANMPSVKHTGSRGSIDYVGAAALVAGVVPLLLALTWAGNLYAWWSMQIIGMLAWSGLMLPTFLLIERSAAEPIIPLWVFRNSVYSVSIVATFMTGLGMFGAVVFIPLFVQGVGGVSATNSGAVIIPMSLSIVVSSTIAGQLISRTGHYKVFGSGGLAIMAVGLYLLSQVDESTTTTTIVQNLMVVGFGLGTTFPVYLIAVQNAFEQRVMGTVTSTTQFFRQIGGTIGVAIMGSLVATGVQRGVREGLEGTLEEVLPKGVREALESPQLLIDVAGRTGIADELAGEAGRADAFANAVELLRVSLADAVGDVFLLSLVFVSVAFIASLFLRELPLKGMAPRRRERALASTGEPAQEPPG